MKLLYLVYVNRGAEYTLYLVYVLPVLLCYVFLIDVPLLRARVQEGGVGGVNVPFGGHGQITEEISSQALLGTGTGLGKKVRVVFQCQ